MKMRLSYFLPVLAILFQESATLAIDSELSTFVKLCFLPRNTANLNLTTISQNAKNPFHVLIGNTVMQEKLAQFLTEKTEINIPLEDLKKMCAKINIESVDEHGMSAGKIWGFENNTATYTCQDSKDFPGILRCNLASASKKFDEDILTFYDIANEDVVMEINCFKNGQVGWVLYSQKPNISEEEKNLYFLRANTLGFPEDTNVRLRHSEQCGV